MRHISHPRFDRGTSLIRKGFTLIELLVVIAILGVLAAALIATVDPFEQIKKAQDSNYKNIAAEFVDANVRYYSTHRALPWYSTANGGTNCYSGGNTLASVPLSNLSGCIAALVSDGELKSGFSNTANLNLLVVTNPNPQTSNATDTIVCFMPESKAQQKDLNTKYAQDGTTGNSCKSSGGTNNCYWCAQ